MPSFFLDAPTTDFSERDVVKKTKLSRLTVRKWLSKLEKNKFLVSRILGRVRYYTLNRSFFETKQLKIFYNTTSDIIKELLKELKKIDAQKVVLFGSYSRGEDRSDSDIDVLVVTTESENKIREIQNHLSTKYKKNLSIITKTPEEYMKLAKSNAVLYRRIVFGGVKYEL